MKKFIYYTGKDPIKGHRLWNKCLEKYGMEIELGKNHNLIIYFPNNPRITIEVVQKSLGLVDFRSASHVGDTCLQKILDCISVEFATEIHSSEGFEYWGYESDWAMEQAFDNFTGPEDQYFYDQFILSLITSKCSFKNDPERQRKYEIGLELVKKYPGLAMSRYKNDLLIEIYSSYRDEKFNLDIGTSKSLIEDPSINIEF